MEILPLYLEDQSLQEIQQIINELDAREGQLNTQNMGIGGSWADQSWLLGLSSYSKGQSQLPKSFAFGACSPIPMVRGGSISLECRGSAFHWSFQQGARSATPWQVMRRTCSTWPHLTYVVPMTHWDNMSHEHQIRTWLLLGPKHGHGPWYQPGFRDPMAPCGSTGHPSPHGSGNGNALRHQYGQIWGSKTMHSCVLWWYHGSHPSTQTLAVGGPQIQSGPQ